MKKVFILEWNPAISDISEEEFASYVPYSFLQFRWEMYDWKSAQAGDLVYMVKCRPAPDAGIVLQGRIIRRPVAGKHWSGNGKPSHYVLFDVDYIINHKECPILPLEALEEAMPEFQWDGGHSGRELPVNESIILERMWTGYLESHRDIFDGKRARSRKIIK